MELSLQTAKRVFRADVPNRLWLTDIAEHWTSGGKLYCCAIKDEFSNRIVGWSVSEFDGPEDIVGVLACHPDNPGGVAGSAQQHTSTRSMGLRIAFRGQFGEPR